MSFVSGLSLRRLNRQKLVREIERFIEIADLAVRRRQPRAATHNLYLLAQLSPLFAIDGRFLT